MEFKNNIKIKAISEKNKSILTSEDQWYPVSDKVFNYWGNLENLREAELNLGIEDSKIISIKKSNPEQSANNNSIAKNINRGDSILKQFCFREAVRILEVSTEQYSTEETFRKAKELSVRIENLIKEEN